MCQLTRNRTAYRAQNDHNSALSHGMPTALPPLMQTKQAAYLEVGDVVVESDGYELSVVRVERSGPKHILLTCQSVLGYFAVKSVLRHALVRVSS